ncbi:membrane integrity-associated transporter subunit PqiC [Shewanella sp. VB17]|uniref:PqiC family protein n=1 Tax=Shewanella sp. VB17 TaxID=2739432 RepID=UPI0015654ABC|nr:ABC-type transport auxiliary lipoprotein family protein [Shewanella sp. VB17]NRD73415.1 membrane integrity-associated transporter subunit PqiC [Shewanella sp. VB17]
MKKYLFFVIVFMIGCSSGSHESQRYLLLAPLTKSIVSQDAPHIIVAPVKLAKYLEQSGLVYRTSPMQVELAKYNLWAQDISAQLTQRLILGLRAKQADYWPVQLSSIVDLNSQPLLEVQLQKFNGSYEGNAEVAGEWIMVDKQREISMIHSFNLSVPLKEEGYPALVDALSKGVEQLTDEIAKELLLVTAQ